MFYSLRTLRMHSHTYARTHARTLYDRSYNHHALIAHARTYARTHAQTICTYTHTHTHTHARERARAHTHTICTYTHTHTPHTRTRTHARTHTHTHARTHTHTHTHTHTDTHTLRCLTRSVGLRRRPMRRLCQGNLRDRRFLQQVPRLLHGRSSTSARLLPLRSYVRRGDS